MNLQPSIPQLFSVEHRLHESREPRAGAQKIRRCNDAVEFRNEDAFFRSAVVSDENIPVPEVFLCRVGYVIRVETARHFRRDVVKPHVVTPNFFLSPEQQLYVGRKKLRNRNHEKCTREKYAFRSCSKFLHFRNCSALSSAYKFQFVATPDECAATTSPAPLIPVVAATIHGEAA